MSLISMQFILFVALAAAGYYVIPKKYQWVWLLVFSYIYYISGGIKLTLFLIFTTGTTYAAGLLLDALAVREPDKKKQKRKKRAAVAGILLLNFGVLGVLKYANFAVNTVNEIFQTGHAGFSFLLPLGISFYTFQSMGYILDVYWGRCKPEKNLFRFALFVSFFPQILQGPIGRFSSLGKQFFEAHHFDGKAIELGIQRILWGYFKKLVIADNAVIFVDAIFGNPEVYNGLSIVGVLAYSIQLYCDFSGGMDVVIGVAQIFGIKLDENFKRPYFAVSITDFWHRWHITLGTWMKDYVFYPVSLSGWMGRFGKRAKKIFGKQIGRTLPICLANIIVFLVVGVWHGAAWKFIVYGLYNGGIIAFSGLMAPAYRKWKKELHISDSSKGFYLFQILRTFLLVNISWFFDRASDIGSALLMMKNAVMHFDLGQLADPGIAVDSAGGTAYMLISLLIIGIGCMVVFVVSLLQERGVDVGEILVKKKLPLRVALYLLVFLLFPALGQTSLSAGGFIYAQF